MSIKFKIHYYLCTLATLTILVNKIHTLTICQQDYSSTSYNLICPTNTLVFVNVLTANFLTSSSQFIAPGSVPCNQQPNLILNISSSQITSVCQYCRPRNPCVITNDFIGLYGLFSSTNFNSQTLTPYNIVINYQCIGLYSFMNTL